MTILQNTPTSAQTEALAKLERSIDRHDVPTTMPAYGRLWLSLDDNLWRITRGGREYPEARERLHAEYTRRALAACDHPKARATTIAASITSVCGPTAVQVATELNH